MSERVRTLGALMGVCLGLAALWGVGCPTARAAADPGFGGNVHVFTPDMPLSQIQATVDQVAAQQLGNQFGTQRVALLFAPGIYGSASAPLNFQVGYYTSVAGLGQQPGDVVINGSVDVYNQCGGSGCVALDNFWRSLSNLTIDVSNASLGCYAGEFWAVSQAAPIRRVQVNGNATLMDYCTGPSFASGGFIADSAFAGGTVVNGSQQQWFVRNSVLDGWSNGVWNQVFSGVTGAPPTCFPLTSTCGPYTTLATSPVTREAPYLYLDSTGAYAVFVPAVQHESSGTSWSAGTPTSGTSIPLSRFYIATPADTAESLTLALLHGQNILFTPGVYSLSTPLLVSRRDTVLLGLGYPTLVPSQGNLALWMAAAPGIQLAGLLVDAGPVQSQALVRVDHGDSFGPGTRPDERALAADPIALHDVFFRIGGATAGSAVDSLVVNADDVILDDIWAWRADHGAGVGWTQNTADHGLVVNGRNVTAYGLFVEHYQKSEIIWNGNNGTDVFLQNEMPYDPPSQAAWMQAPGIDGYPALRVGSGVATFHGYGLGSYSLFSQGVPIFASNAFEVPRSLAAGSLTDLLTIFLNTSASGGILDVVDGKGGSSTAANPDTPVTVVSYP